MSVLSEWFEKRFRRKALEWLLRPETCAAILAAPAIATWLEAQPPAVASAVREAVPRILLAIADKWFGG